MKKALRQKESGESEGAKSLPLSDNDELKTQLPLSEKDEMQQVWEKMQKQPKKKA